MCHISFILVPNKPCITVVIILEFRSGVEDNRLMPYDITKSQTVVMTAVAVAKC